MCHEIPDFPSTTGVMRRLICPKFVFGRGSAPDPDGELMTLLQTPYSRLRRGNSLPIVHPLNAYGVSICLVPNFTSESWQPYTWHCWDSSSSQHRPTPLWLSLWLQRPNTNILGQVKSIFLSSLHILIDHNILSTLIMFHLGSTSVTLL